MESVETNRPLAHVDKPDVNDNRDYDYSSCEVNDRAEYPVIASWVAKGSRVIDFGCGNGSLLALLQREKNCQTVGIDISESGVRATKKKNIEAYVRKIDEKQEQIKDNAFDYAICNVTLQMVMYPEILLNEMGRIARYQIISFPNFGFFKNRLDLLLHGRMPRPLLYNYKWYSTGHIHQFSISDFRETCLDFGFTIRKFHPLDSYPAKWKTFLARNFPKLFSSCCIFELEKKK